MCLSEKSQILLKQAGWFSGRQVNTSAWEDALTKNGYPIFPEASRFIAEFGGLVLVVTYAPLFHFPSLGFPRSVTDECHFDVTRTISHTFRQNVAAVSALLDVPLCPVGEFYSGSATLLMAPNGIVYTDVDEPEIQVVGMSGVEAVENILTRRSLTPFSRAQTE